MLLDPRGRRRAAPSGGKTGPVDIDVVHRPGSSRFEAQVEDEVAFLSYERADGTAVLTHTVVPAQLQGRGIGGRLAEAAVGWARAEGLEVDPRCSFVRGWLAGAG